MKIITNNFAYVQKEDLFNILFIGLSTPDSLLTKIFEKDNIMISDSNRYDFVKFENKNEINFLKKIDWIVDYSDIKDLSNNEIANLIKNAEKEMTDILIEYNDDENNYWNYKIKKQTLNAKIFSLKKIFYLKSNKTFFSLPDDLDSSKTVSNKNGIKKLIMKLIH